MTRKKVKLAWIANDAARKASLKKRRAGLMKKVSELSILCGVNAFVIIYSPDDPEPVFWPSHSVAEKLLMRFQSMPEVERTKKMTNQESYLKERVKKLQDQAKKYERKKMELELCYLMHQLYQVRGVHELRTSELEGLVWLINEKIKDLRKKIEYSVGDFNEVNNPVDANSAFQDQWSNDGMKHKKSSTGASTSTMTDVRTPHQYNDDDGSSSVGTALSIFRRSNVGDNSTDHGQGFCYGRPHHANLRALCEASLHHSGPSHGNMGGRKAEVNYFIAGLTHGNMGDNNNGGNKIDLELPHEDNFDLGPNHQTVGENNLGPRRSHGSIIGLADLNSIGSDIVGNGCKGPRLGGDGSSGSDTGVNESIGVGNNDGIPVDATKNSPDNNSSA